jgi:hypothetical protein
VTGMESGIRNRTAVVHTPHKVADRSYNSPPGEEVHHMKPEDKGDTGSLRREEDHRREECHGGLWAAPLWAMAADRASAWGMWDRPWYYDGSERAM